MSPSYTPLLNMLQKRGGLYPEPKRDCKHKHGGKKKQRRERHWGDTQFTIYITKITFDMHKWCGCIKSAFGKRNRPSDSEIWWKCSRCCSCCGCCFECCWAWEYWYRRGLFLFVLRCKIKKSEINKREVTHLWFSFLMISSFSVLCPFLFFDSWIHFKSVTEFLQDKQYAMLSLIKTIHN